MLHEAAKYRNYQAADFAADEAFLDWVLSGKQAEAWESWLEQNQDKQEAINEAKQLVRLIRGKEREISNGQIEALWTKIDSATEKGKSNEVKVIPFYQSTLGRVGMAVAASILLLLGFFWFNQSETTYQTGIGEQLAVTLPDGSSVTLNAASSISFHKGTWQEKREVILRGEGFFEVEEGEQFTVKTSLGSVSVLGTSFNVQERENLLNVACYTGKVRVQNEYKVSQTLTPGKKIRVEQEKVSLDDFVPEETIAWRKGIFRFDDIPLNIVLDELKRQYGINIELKANIKNRRYSGSFTKDDLEGALKMICLPMELKYKIAEDNSTVVIEQE